MQAPEDPRETLKDIRNLMERSSRFISLSGLSGVAAGCFALLCSITVYWYLDLRPFQHQMIYYQEALTTEKWGLGFTSFVLLVGGITLILALLSAWIFTRRKAKRDGVAVWDKTTKKLLQELLIPLVAGGIFCLALIMHEHFGMIAPATLVFYGLALLGASKYTFQDVQYLGMTEIGLGLIAAFLPGFGLEFWTLGFGLAHIIYGLAMYNKYERAA